MENSACVYTFHESRSQCRTLHPFGMNYDYNENHIKTTNDDESLKMVRVFTTKALLVLEANFEL